MSETDISNFLKWPYSSICSDGASEGHPRGHGAFTRFLGKYVRDEKLMPLETAIFKMTALAAEHVGILDRGLIAPGFCADLVLFDPATVNDKATIREPKALSTGINRVWVNGQEVFGQQKAIPNFPGQFVKRGGSLD
jgi:N-acyl-D-aspartate/D-glutamate deacylase